MSAAVYTPIVAARERPILFSKPLVLALLAGRKSVTRRLVRGAPDEPNVDRWDVFDDGTWGPSGDCGMQNGFREAKGPSIRCPFGLPGDRLWVRETWRPRIAHGCAMDACDCADVNVTYAADDASIFFPEGKVADAWFVPKAATNGNVPGIHMPRWASRITLSITDVRVERLAAISDDEIVAEGVDRAAVEQLLGEPVIEGAPLRDLWRLGWDALNGQKAPFSSSPWVWRIGFRVVPQIGSSS